MEVQNFIKGDRVKVQYSLGKFYEGTVLWTQKYSGLDWVTVRPDEAKMIYTFGSSHDMDNGYKTYIANDSVLGQVQRI
jgi:hypothetical protein